MALRSQDTEAPGAVPGGTPALDTPAAGPPGPAVPAQPAAGPAAQPAAEPDGPDDSGYVLIRLAQHTTVDGKNLPPETELAVRYSQVMAFVNAGNCLGVEPTDRAAIQEAHKRRLTTAELASYPVYEG